MTQSKGELAEAQRLVGNWLEPGHNAPNFYDDQPASYAVRQAIRCVLDHSRASQRNSGGAGE